MAIDRNAQARMQFNQKTREQQRAKTPTQPAPESAEAPPAEGEGDAALTPEEQKISKDAVTAAATMLYKNKKIGKAVAQMIQKPPHYTGVGEGAAMLTIKMDEQMNLPEDLILTVGFHVAEVVSDLGAEIGFYQEDERFVKSAINETMKHLFKHYPPESAELEAVAGEVPPQQLQGAVQEVSGGQ